METNPTCQACQSSRIEYLTPNDDELIHGIDYIYRCELTGDIVDRDFSCDKFELPF